MTDSDYLYCLLHQWLDREEELEALCPSCREKAMERRCPVCGARTEDTVTGSNQSFDMERFRRLKGES